MRINRLRLKNLNSLRGEFVIDFDRPPLSEAGIFAITGPTGAGKTTILDAICVALYGQTPRLTAGQSGELLAKHCGECLAEVEFTVTKGRYRARWSRHRARGRAEGKLQAVVMELIAIGPEDERIVEEQPRLVVERVEELTGLDFTRFTRSALLAQGGFASFLRAKDNERAELLERMTGTEIYSQISIAAFDRLRVERQRLEELILKSEALDLLPPEELSRTEEEATAIKAAIETGQARIATLRSQAELAAAQLHLKTAQEDTRRNLTAAEAALSSAGQDWERLAQAELAAPLRGGLQHFDTLGQRLAESETQATALARDQHRLKSEQEAAQDRMNRLREEAACFQEEAVRREAEIKEAERLDQTLTLTGQALQEKRRLIGQLTREEGKLSSSQRDEERILRQADAELASLTEKLNATKADLGLGHDLSLIAAALGELTPCRTRFSRLKKQREERERHLAGQEAESTRRRDQQRALRQAADRIGERLTAHEQTFLSLSQGRPLAELEAKAEEGRARLARLDACLRQRAEARRLRLELTERKRRLFANGAGIEEAQTALALARLDKDQAETRLAELLARQTLARAAASYQEARQRLIEGDPCPLCGSRQHPWQDHTPPLDEEGPELAGLKKRVGELLALIGGQESLIGERRAEAERLRLEVEASKLSAQQAEDKLSQTAQAAGLNDPGQAESERELLAGRLEDELKTLTALRLARDEAEAARRQMEGAEKDEAQTATALAGLEAQIVEQRQTAAMLAQEESALLATGQELAARLAPRLAPYGVATPQAGEEDACLTLLRRRWQEHDHARQRREEIELKTGQRRQTMAGLSAQIEALLVRLRDEGQTEQALAQEYGRLRASRRALLGDEAVEAARAGIATRREGIEDRKAQEEERLAELNRRLAAAEALAFGKRAETERLSQELSTAETGLARQAQALNLSDLTRLRQALMSENEMHTLRERRQGMLALTAQLAERLRELGQEWDRLLATAPGLVLETIRVELSREEEGLSRRQRELGARQEIIGRQRALSAELQRRQEEIEGQRRGLAGWQTLADLIGSADGKKFRRFAQGLTLEHLIAIANRHLARLSDRYLLSRHPEEELGLTIIDTYQADSVRPTGTLSGGEEFLVSLALALGLASLAGQSRIDSLFLDEGFGTLDTDTLETALSALSALNQSGKTVGVISHVEALKERIPTQIRLIRLAGGVSRLAVL